MLTKLEGVDGLMKMDDLYLCAFLACKGHKPTAVEQTPYGRRYFVYDEVSRASLDELVRKFYSGEVTVSVPILRSYVKDLKDVLQDAK